MTDDERRVAAAGFLVLLVPIGGQISALLLGMTIAALLTALVLWSERPSMSSGNRAAPYRESGGGTGSGQVVGRCAPAGADLGSSRSQPTIPAGRERTDAHSSHAAGQPSCETSGADDPALLGPLSAASLPSAHAAALVVPVSASHTEVFPVEGYFCPPDAIGTATLTETSTGQFVETGSGVFAFHGGRTEPTSTSRTAATSGA